MNKWPREGERNILAAFLAQPLPFRVVPVGCLCFFSHFRPSMHKILFFFAQILRILKRDCMSKYISDFKPPQKTQDGKIPELENIHLGSDLFKK